MIWLALSLALAQDAPADGLSADADTEADSEAPEATCGLRVKREITPSITSALPAGSPGCAVRMTVDERGQVSAVEGTNCPAAVLSEITPDLERWKFERTDCPVDDPLAFDITFESESKTFLVPPIEPVPMDVIPVPAGVSADGCLMVMTLLPDGTLENVRSTGSQCSVSLGGSGWNPARFWRAEIDGLRCTANFEVRDGIANNVSFSGCGGPSRLALVSFVERAAWSPGLEEPTNFEVRFRMRDDESAPLERAAEEVRLIRDACAEPQAPGFLARKTRIPAMPSRWAQDQSNLAAYCRLRVHLGADAVPTRIDAVLCGGVYGPRAASAVTGWNFRAPTCGETPVESEVVVVVPFARRIPGAGFLNPLGGQGEVVDLARVMMKRQSELDHCELWIDVPSTGLIRVQTSDPARCNVTPTSVPNLRRRQLIKWAEVTDEWDIFCDTTFTARTMSTGEPEVGVCYLETNELAREAIRDWSWSVLGREAETYTVHWRYRLD